MRGSHLALDCAVVDGLAARAEEVGEAVADHALGPRAAAALPPALSLGHSAAGQSQVSELEPLWCIRACDEASQRFHNHTEGSYYGLFSIVS